MKTYVVRIGKEAVLAFRAENDDEAHAMIDDKEGTIRSDLKVLVGRDEKSLWDGKSAIQVQEATAAQHAAWEESRDQAISDGEIDLDAGNNPDEWNVYLMAPPERTKFSAKTDILTGEKSLQPFPILGNSATMASVVIRMPATDDASWSAVRTT